MRAILAALALLAATACERKESAPAREPACARSAAQDISFSDPAAPDRAEARAEGPSCARAVLTLSLHSPAGAPLYAFSAPFIDLAYGGSRPEGDPDVSAEEMDRFLAAWADLSVMPARALASWRNGAPGPGGGDGDALAFATPMGRAEYESIRARDPPAACHAAALEVTHCLVFDPDARTARLMLAFGPHGADLEMDQ